MNQSARRRAYLISGASPMSLIGRGAHARRGVGPQGDRALGLRRGALGLHSRVARWRPSARCARAPLSLAFLFFCRPCRRLMTAPRPDASAPASAVGEPRTAASADPSARPRESRGRAASADRSEPTGAPRPDRDGCAGRRACAGIVGVGLFGAILMTTVMMRAWTLEARELGRDDRLATAEPTGSDSDVLTRACVCEPRLAHPGWGKGVWGAGWGARARAPRSPE